MTTVTKDMTFDAAHMLTGYEGRCRNLHGHTYHLFVEARGELNDEGMVVDFRLLKELMTREIADRFDHAFMYCDKSPVELEIARVLESNGLKTVPLPFPTTAENLARYFYGVLAGHVDVSAVRLMETPTSCAEYRP